MSDDATHPVLEILPKIQGDLARRRELLKTLVLRDGPHEQHIAIARRFELGDE